MKILYKGGGEIVKATPNKIHIIGSVASGKTTLAKDLSMKLQIPYYELDNVVWKRSDSGDIRRSEEERKAHLLSITQTDRWIVEGVHSEEWVSGSFQQADVIVFLDTNYSKRTYRIVKRYVKQKLGQERAHYQPNLTIFFKMFKWNKHFEQVGKPFFFHTYKQYQNKIFVIKNENELSDLFRK